jgi:hypothetical protein
VFGIWRGKVVGCIVSVKGIEANQDKINAILHMKPPQSKKEVQKLKTEEQHYNDSCRRWHNKAYHSS